jgi:hypothetical protein
VSTYIHIYLILVHVDFLACLLKRRAVEPVHVDFVACLLKRRAVEPEKQVMLGNGSVTWKSAREVVFCMVHGEAI